MTSVRAGESPDVAVADQVRVELLEASDAQIEDAIQYADPMVLRGLLYQLTGDETLAAMPVVKVTAGFIDAAALANESDVERVRAKAVEFLRQYRDGGAGELGIGPQERLPRSLALTVGKAGLDDSEVANWLEELALDPWARGLHWEQPPPPQALQNFSVVVIGAGMGGLGAAAQLKHAGISFSVIEKNPEVGGTWWENRYPGARVDSPSRGYQHILGADFVAPYLFCPQEDNQRYFEWFAEKYELRDSIEFETEVRSVVWDDEAAEWVITAQGPSGERVWRANAVISAVGLLSRPNLPQIEGMDDFGGQSWHTACWPEGYDIAGKRFAVIGTGCTGYQMIPELARDAGHVYVFQRTPQWLFDLPGYLSPYPPQVNWLDRNFPYYLNFMRFVTLWYAGPEIAREIMDVEPGFDDPHTRSPHNKRTREQRIAFLERKLADRPDLLEHMIPVHPPFSSRPVLCDADYSVLDALVSDNVTLVVDGIERITAAGILAQDGTEYEVDAITYATGYKANDFLWPMEVRGRDGLSVDELWTKDGPRAYGGVMLPGFPNFFVIYGPNSNPFGGGGIVPMEEIVTRFALECMQRLILDDCRTVDVTEEAYDRYNAVLDEREAQKMYSDPRAHNYFRNEFGRSSTNCALPTTELWHMLRKPLPGDIVLS